MDTKETYILPCLLRNHTRITYVTIKTENWEYIINCLHWSLRNKNVFKIVLNVSTEFAVISEYDSPFQRRGATWTMIGPHLSPNEFPLLQARDRLPPILLNEELWVSNETLILGQYYCDFLSRTSLEFSSPEVVLIIKWCFQAIQLRLSLKKIPHLFLLFPISWYRRMPRHAYNILS